MEESFFSIPWDLVSKNDMNETPLPPYRSTFMRDRDRIMYCTAFRRLAGKTQIYTIGSDDHKKNRLTHSLEVAQISRTIAHALGLNEDLAEAIALGHDFGHTPFGHAGERMLHQIMVPNSNFIKNSPLYHTSFTEISDTLERESDGRKLDYHLENLFGFKHNIQSVRVAEVIEDNYRNDDGKNIGLNLTNYTLWGIMNHSQLTYRDDDSLLNFHEAFKTAVSLRGFETEAWSFEAYIVRISDDIAQWHHDLEDAIRGDAISTDAICSIIIEALKSELNEKEIACLESNKSIKRVDKKCIAELSHIVVNSLVSNIVDFSRKNLETIRTEIQEKFEGRSNEDYARMLYTKYETLGLSIERDHVIALSNAIKTDEFKNAIRGSVHHSRDVERMNEKGCYIIRKIFEAYYSHPQQLPDGPILHFMVSIGEYDNVDSAKSDGVGKVRTRLETILKNQKTLDKIILMRRICDHIASMTDRYAIEEYNNLYG